VRGSPPNKVNYTLLPLVLHGCETWSRTVRKVNRLEVCDEKVLRRIFGPKKQEVTGWRKLHNEEFHNFQSSSDIVTMIKSSRFRWAGYAACRKNKKCI